MHNVENISAFYFYAFCFVCLIGLFLLNNWCSKPLLAIECIDYIFNLPELSNVLSACVDFLLLLKEANGVLLVR